MGHEGTRPLTLTRPEIEFILPHRDPFFFLDRVTDLEYGRRGVGWIDELNRYEAILAGHFPGVPALPGVILVEALGELGAVVVLGAEDHRGQVGLLTGLDGWHFQRMVRQGDHIRLQAEVTKLRLTSGVVRLSATIDGHPVADGEMSFALMDREDLEH